MNLKQIFGAVAAIATTIFCVSCGESIPKVSDSKEDFHIFVLMGDDYMSGRSAIKAEEPQAYDSHIVMLDQDGNWVPAKYPLQFDSSEAAAGPGLWFARAYAEMNKTTKVGLVPCACSGSVIAEWAAGATCKKTGTKPFDQAVERTQKAMADGTLKGVLWMQGFNEKSASGYGEKVSKLISSFRNKVGNHELPFIMTKMIKDRDNKLSKVQTDINDALQDLYDYKKGNDTAFSLIPNSEIWLDEGGKFVSSDILVELDGRFLSAYLIVSGYNMWEDSAKK